MSARDGVAYEHVAFDLDGTVIDSRADLTAAVNHVLRRLGLAELPPATLYRYVGDGARVLVERALGPEHRDGLARGEPLQGLAFALNHARYGAPPTSVS